MRKTASNVDLCGGAAIDDNAGNVPVAMRGRYRTDSPKSREACGRRAGTNVEGWIDQRCDHRWINLQGVMGCEAHDMQADKFRVERPNVWSCAFGLRLGRLWQTGARRPPIRQFFDL